MSHHRKLASLRVRDIEHMLVDEPSWVYESASIEEVMQKMLADLRTRWVYVVDAQKRLVGGVPMNAIVEILFPLEAIIEHPQPLYEAYFPKTGAQKACDLMLSPLPNVREETTLEEMAALLLNKQINEIPVVDSVGALIGEVNVCEVIKAYLGNSAEPGKQT
jgi:CBS domain-containing protein